MLLSGSRRLIASALLQVIIYSGDGLSTQQLLESAASNFNITVTDKFQVHLQSRLPHITSLLQRHS